jgi:subtilase family serine protease
VAAIIADREGYFGRRTGNANPLIYQLALSPSVLGVGGYFHDINGIGQSTDNNGIYPATVGYDMATGVGSPIMSPIITGVPALPLLGRRH